MTSLLSTYFIMFQRNELKNRILISFSLSIFIFQPAILKSLFEILKCKGMYPDPGKAYIFSDMSEECYTSTYYRWIFFLVIPAFLFYVILFPIFFNFYIKKNDSGVKSIDLIRKNHILKLGFRKEKYYW